MNYRSVFLTTTILIGEKSATSCLITRHLDEKSHVIANKEFEACLTRELAVGYLKNCICALSTITGSQ
jgi:hypothetical protein